MAFWAMKKHKWFKKPFPNMILMYKKKRYDDWYNSLSPEGKKKEDERKAKIEREGKEAMYKLLAISSIIQSLYRKTGFDYSDLL